jgi:hypothetical protein
VSRVAATLALLSQKAKCDQCDCENPCPLQKDSGYSYILTITDRLNLEFRLIPTRSNITAKELALIFFDKWYCENGLPLELISDHDKLFMSCFWHYLTLLTGIKHKASTSYHPQTDGASE